MPPKKPPTQAGKFKPVKRPAKKPSDSSSAAPPASNSVAAATASSSGRGDGGRGGRGGRDGGRGGRGRGDGGRGRDGRGRGRGRGGRFIVPTGAAFFTGAMAKGEGGAAGGASAVMPGTVGAGGLAGAGAEIAVKMEPGRDGSVIMPGMMSSSSGRDTLGGSSNSNSMAARGVSKNVAESMAAAARARLGEGEEIIVAEMELDPGEDAEEGRKKSVLDGPSSSGRFDGMPSLFDHENENNGTAESEGMSDAAIADAFVYDSDSSLEEERRKKREKLKKNSGRDRNFGEGIPPAQLPFPVGPSQSPMYACQEKKVEKTKKLEEEKKDSEDTTKTSTSKAPSSKLSDPPLHSPFLDMKLVSEEVRRIETYSWFLMKFPTRLPHLDVTSSGRSNSSGARNTTSSNDDDNDDNDEGQDIGDDAVVKNEQFAIKEDVDLIGESKGGSAAAGVGAMATTSLPSGAGPVGYDDTLKDIPPGRYGRIVVRKSGKTELIVGGDGSPEVSFVIIGAYDI
ncbi:hypothetical protein ACHAXS_005879 [Conticribra weissflogii]